MLSPRNLAAGVSAFALAVAMASVGYAVDITKVKLYPNKAGTVSDFQPITKYCGTKPLKVALSDGWGGNYWRHITRAEFEDEASKCKNITETRYTDGEFKPEKQIADIEGLIAQKYDVIVTFLDGGPAILKATREAQQAGVAVVPYDTGDSSTAPLKARRRSASRPPNGWSRRSTAKVPSSCSAARRAIR
jgi:ribose transport system substrate-binding protein